MGRSKQTDLDRLLDQVARGERRLDSIRDAGLREAVRIALRIHQTGRDAPGGPDDYARRRMRARVLAELRPRGPGLLDHAWTALELLARPAPYIVRSVAIAALLVAVGMSATVAAADTLPDDLLYPVKLASETLRLALAAAPDDRASVELSIADHRLSEAERLAANGRSSDALVASAMYMQHVATAAAELAPDASSGLAQQLDSTFTSQRERAFTLATTLATDTRSKPAAYIFAAIARPTDAPGLTVAQRVAVTAAGVAQQLQGAAEQDADDATNAAAAQAVFAPARSATVTSSPTSPRATAPNAAAATPHAASGSTLTSGPSAATAAPTTRTSPTDGTRPTDARASARPEQRETAHPEGPSRATTEAERKANEVLKAVRSAAEQAKAAADKAKGHK